MQIADCRWPSAEVGMAAALMAMAGFTGTAAAQQPAQACSASAQPSRRVDLTDGRTVSVDVRSVAMSGDRVLAAGDRAYVFPREIPSRPISLMQDSIIGFMTDREGRNASLVLNPLLPTAVRYTRVADAGNGAFHALLMTTADSTDVRQDSATIWYARYAGGKWTVPERVAGVRNGSVTADGASALIARNGILGFVYPIGDNEKPGTTNGLVLLRRRNGIWSQDTLRTEEPPHSTRIAHGRDPDTYVVAYVEPGAHTSDALYLVRFEGGWSARRHIGGNGGKLLASEPALVRLDEGLVASWVLMEFFKPETGRLEWLRLDDGGKRVAAGFAGSGRGTWPFETVAIDGRTPLWLHQGEPYPNTLAMALAPESAAMAMPNVALPFENATPTAIAIGSRVMVFTIKQGRAPGEPVGASYTTILEIRCPRSARR